MTRLATNGLPITITHTLNKMRVWRRTIQVRNVNERMFTLNNSDKTTPVRTTLKLRRITVSNRLACTRISVPKNVNTKMRRKRARVTTLLNLTLSGMITRIGVNPLRRRAVHHMRKIRTLASMRSRVLRVLEETMFKTGRNIDGVMWTVRLGDRIDPLTQLRLTNTRTRLGRNTSIIIYVRRLTIHRMTRFATAHWRDGTNNRHVLNKGLTNGRTANQRLNDHRMLTLNHVLPVQDQVKAQIKT